MVRHAVLMMLVPVVLAGCTGRGEGPYADLEPARLAVDGLQGRRCHYIQEPPLPATIDVIARPGTRGALLFWARDSAPGDTVELSVRYGDDGKLAWTRPIRSTVAPGRVAELARLIGAGLSEEGPPDWGMRLLVVGGHVEAVLPTVICWPERGARIGQIPRPVGTVRDAQEAQQARGRPIEVLVSLDEMGRILDARLVRGTGSRILDQFGIDVARAYRYEPKLHDGLGVPSTLTLRVPMRRR